MPAGETDSQVYPRIAGFQALFTAIRIRLLLRIGFRQMLAIRRSQAFLLFFCLQGLQNLVFAGGVDGKFDFKGGFPGLRFHANLAAVPETTIR